jgi:hypothetical protein
VESAKTKAFPDTDASLVITHSELTSRHGVGALLVKILREEPSLVVFHSKEVFKSHDLKVPAFHIPSTGLFRSGQRLVRNLLAHKKVRRILCVPFYQDDVQIALTCQACSGAPLALYIMDDQNVWIKKIPDRLMGALVHQAAICFAISPALCAAYEEKYNRRFWLVPPVADPDTFVPPDYKFTPQVPPRGILIGNLWSSNTLAQFRDTVRLSGLQIDWYGNAGKPYIKLDPEVLEKEGIFLHSHVPEPELVKGARAADFAVIPAGTLDGSDTHDWLARASLPSRIVYLMAAANTPMIVMGHAETAAARFVTDLELGGVCGYSPDTFKDAVNRVTDPSTSNLIRTRARSLSPTFSSRGLSNWLWESMAKGQPVDDRFEALKRMN